MKKIISLFIIFIMIATAVNAQPLYSKTTEEIITGGVNLKNIQRFYGDYALNINLMTVDLKNENLSLELLKNDGGSDKTDTVMNLAKSEENVVAAINADFFSAYKGDQNFSLGLEIKDGKLLQSHINKDMAAGFVEDGELFFSYLDFSGEITAPNGVKTSLSHINKPTDYYGALLMYTPNFNAGTSPFLPVGITAVTVIDGKVSAKGVSLGGTIPIPQNGYILVIDDNMTPFLEYNFNVGDAVELDVRFNPSVENVETAFGGGTLLLKNGEKTKITHDVSGNNPRSVIGTNADGTEVYFLTVDGRQSISRGVSLAILANICQELGMVNAMNLDGGGSTAMVGKTLSKGELQKINSPSENRKVINAVGVSLSAQPGEAVGFMAEAEKEAVVSGGSVKLRAIPYDINYNTPVSVSEEARWVLAEGEGYVKDGVYYAKGSTKAVLEVYFGDKKTDTCEINVISESTTDELCREETGGFTFNVLGFSPVTTLFDRLIYARGMDLFRNADASAVIGGELLSDLTPEAASPIDAGEWTEHDFENLKAVSLSINSNGIIQRGEQWKKLAAILKSAEQKNLIVLVDSVYDFAADIDREAFSSMLAEGAKNKNVFVVYNGDENSSLVRDNVRFISLSDAKDEESVKGAIENVKYLSFNINPDTITYSFKKLYE